MTKSFKSEKKSSSAKAMQVMVQSGRFSKYMWRADAGQWQVEEPMIRPALLLEQQTADFLCEGVLRHYPVDICEPQALQRLAEYNDLVILSKCCDRASANFAFLGWFWSVLAQGSAPTTILPWAEPCSAHGVALVKSRPKGSKEVIAKSHSLQALLHNWRTLEAFRKAIVQIISSRLEQRHEQRPAASKDASARFVKALFPEGEPGVVDYMYKVNKNGEKTPKPFWKDVQELALLWEFSFSNDEDEKIIHYCCAEPNSWACTKEGRRPGQPCCQNREEAVERMATPLINILVHGPWDRSAANRWNYALKILRLIIVGFFSGGVLPMALKELKFCWDVADNMTAQLAALVAKNTEDWSSKNKLKLLKICKVFCAAGVEAKIAITVHIIVVVDRMLYSILGDGSRKRASLFSLVSEEKSIICSCKEELLRLLEDWGRCGEAEHSSWDLYQFSRNSFMSQEHKAFARQELLQSGCSILEHFELRLSRPPYTILKFMDDAVSSDRKREVADEFVHAPKHCISLFGVRVQEQCPTAAQLLEKGPHIARALDGGAEIAIDHSERAHGDMRKDLRSSGPAKSFTVSANRNYCHQVAAAHNSRPGAQDPLVCLPLASSVSSQCREMVEVGDLKKQPKAQPGVLSTTIF